MSWKLKMHERRPEGQPAVGDIWPEDAYVGKDADRYRSQLSQEYRNDHQGRRSPYVVRLPDGSDYVLDFQRGLRVTEENGVISLNGEINLPGRFFGTIRDGELLTIKELAKVKEEAARKPTVETPAVEARRDERQATPAEARDMHRQG